MKLLATLISATIIFTCLYSCLVLGNSLLDSIDKAGKDIVQHNNYLTEVER